MREIKFRAWHKEFKQMKIFKLEDLESGSIDMSNPDNLKMTFAYWHLQDCELMQFTGLHDKNGKEIWEGDRLKIKGQQWEDGEGEEPPFYVEWNRYKGAWRINDGTLLSCIPTIYIEVIGNIYKNPELIKEEKNG